MVSLISALKEDLTAATDESTVTIDALNRGKDEEILSYALVF